ncbi:MAG TPA: hypothetical protein PKC15_17435 [Rhodocyclaceae bacterium]|nr:hypothetical protein [Rhodocyclaceae bacterium]
MSLYDNPQQAAWVIGQMPELDRRYQHLRALLERAGTEDVPMPEIDLARNDVSALLDAMVPPAAGNDFGDD